MGATALILFMKIKFFKYNKSVVLKNYYGNI